MRKNLLKVISFILILIFTTYYVFSKDTIIKAYSIGDIKDSERANLKLLHNEACDDVNPIWSQNRKIIAFERISRGKGSSQGIYYFKLPGEYLIKPIVEVKGEKVKNFRSELGYYDDTSDHTSSELYASYFNWIPINKENQEFIYTEKVNLYTGNIDKEGVKVTQLFVSWERISTEINDAIPFISHSVGGEKLYLLRKNGTVVSDQKGMIKSLENIPREFVSNKYPDCSQNGNVVFVSGLTGNGDLYLLNLKDKDNLNSLRRLTFSNEVDTTPKWSPDGTKIVYSSYGKGNMDIYLITNLKDKVERIQLTNWPMEELNPTWSPDGEKIAFYTLKKVKNVIDLWVMDFDGDNRKLIASNVLRNERNGPCWLPSQLGRKLIYISEFGDSLHIVDVDTSKTWQINVDNQVMSDVDCSLYQLGKSKDLIIAYSAQHKNGRKRIFIKKIAMRGVE